jgi:hypothetical protein
MAENKTIAYTIPASVQKLLRIFQRYHKKEEKALESENKIEIGETISRLAFFYEKFRNSIDYKEEHLLRKNATHRILKRRFVPGVDTQTIAEPLLKELIQGGYLKNKGVPESKIIEIGEIIDKYALLINHVYQHHKSSDNKEVFDWIVSVCACEIEENLGYKATERAMVDFMYHILNERIIIKGNNKHSDIRDIQIYISILKTLVRYDSDMIGYNILRYYFPDWQKPQHHLVDYLAKNIVHIKFKIELQQENYLGERINRIVRKYIPIFAILMSIIEKNPEKSLELFQDPLKLEKVIKESCEEKYKQVRAKLKRTSFRSIIYIFLTKMLVALILEIPYELFLTDEKLNYLPLAVNVIFHPALLFVIALIIRVPTEENTKKISAGIKDIVYNYPEKNIKHYIKPAIERGVFTDLVFQSLYFLTFFITFGFIIFVLYVLNFNIVGVVLFILFLSLVTFFGFRVRQGARELLIEDDRDSFVTVIINFFSVPIIRAGRFMSQKFAKINFLVFFFDVIIEAPFKLIMDIFEDWSSYIKEKKEEIYDRD